MYLLLLDRSRCATWACCLPVTSRLPSVALWWPWVQLHLQDHQLQEAWMCGQHCKVGCAWCSCMPDFEGSFVLHEIHMPAATLQIRDVMWHWTMPSTVT